jgi:hypothetical protein
MFGWIIYPTRLAVIIKYNMVFLGEGKNFGKRLRKSLKGRKRTNAESGSTLLSKFTGGKTSSSFNWMIMIT